MHTQSHALPFFLARPLQGLGGLVSFFVALAWVFLFVNGAYSGNTLYVDEITNE